MSAGISNLTSTVPFAPAGTNAFDVTNGVRHQSSHRAFLAIRVPRAT